MEMENVRQSSGKILFADRVVKDSPNLCFVSGFIVDPTILPKIHTVILCARTYIESV